jgi:hypothetical protein
MYNHPRRAPAAGVSNPMTPPAVSPTSVTLVARHTEDDMHMEDVEDEGAGQTLFTDRDAAAGHGGAGRPTPQQQSFKVVRGGVSVGVADPRPLEADPTIQSAAPPTGGNSGKSLLGRQHSTMQRQSSNAGIAQRKSVAGFAGDGDAPPGAVHAPPPQLLVLGGSDVGNANPQILNKLRKRMGSLAPDTINAAQAAADKEAAIPDAPQRSNLGGATNKRLIPIMSLAVMDPLRKARWRTARQMFAFTPVFCIIICALCSCGLLTGVMWTHEKGTGSVETATRWREYSPSQGLCQCISLRESQCGDQDHYFQGVTNIDILLLCVEMLMLVLLSWEIAGFGVFGGPQYLSRGQLALSLISMASAGLSLGAYLAAYLTRFCGRATFKRQGLQLGWGFFLRAMEILGLIGYVALVAYTGLGANRGPPTFSLLIVMIVMCASVFSTLSHSWMTTQDGTEDYGAFTQCICGLKACDDEAKFDSLLKFNLVLTIFQFLAFVFSAFFTFLRAVDNVGGTVKMSQASAGAGLVICIVNLIVFVSSLPYQTSCGGVTVEYEPGLAVNWFIGVIIAGCIYLVVNGIYLSKFLTPKYEQFIMDVEFAHTGIRQNYYISGSNETAMKTKAAAESASSVIPNHHDSSPLISLVKAPTSDFDTMSQASFGGTSRRPRPQHETVTLSSNHAKHQKENESDVRTFYQAFYWDELQDRRSQLHELAELLEAQEDQQAKTLEGDIKDAKESAKMFDLKKFFF